MIVIDDFKVVEPPATVRMLSYQGDKQGCGYIRIAYPALLLNQYKDRYQYRFEADYMASFINDIRFYQNFTFVQFQRSATKAHLDLFNHYITNIRRQNKVPIIYEIDDLLKDIPIWNYASSYYNKNNAPIFEMLRMVDGVTCSTEDLKNVYQEYNQNIVVIPNHLPKFIWGDIQPKHFRQPRELKDRPRIGWAGSENHFCNPLTPEFKKGVRGGDFGIELLNFIRKTVDKYQWVISGGVPVELNDVRDKIEVHPWVSVLQYPGHLKKLDLDIGMAPLEQCLFNECKSNIKALEITAIGCPGVYSEISPYKKMSLTSLDDYGIIAYIEKLASDISFRQETFERDYEIVKDVLFWEENDNIRRYVNSYLSLFKKKLKD